ncbi:uncharacterized protein G2W53_022256 [Senna tora]|uniref:Uncharacterized protein n=1 Tax=Senna tora TaxID=362788 RepID=A0A834TL57_9FABA|nr:uncharacterized protein G2W53_022256 [Senna tora]
MATGCNNPGLEGSTPGGGLDP